ncbi:MAG: sigma-70 family RNA polymerase sigma factor [Bacilli bacterium]|jgi:RNA polymerase sigma factor (sigma-70 family)|nr:sigma-70 family RNA polymerase sigma factor [Bacilli bacterium]
MSENDYELLYYCYMNDEKAFEMLQNKYRKLIYFIINRFIERYKLYNCDVDDIYNESLLLLYKNIYSFKDQYSTSFKSYFTACLNKYLANILRSNLALKRSNYHNKSDYSLDYYNNDNLSFGNVIADNRSSYIKDMNNYLYIKNEISSLTNHITYLELTVFYLFVSGYSYKEIALILQVNIKKIEYIIRKCRKYILY